MRKNIQKQIKTKVSGLLIVFMLSVNSLSVNAKSYDTPVTIGHKELLAEQGIKYNNKSCKININKKSKAVQVEGCIVEDKKDTVTFVCKKSGVLKVSIKSVNTNNNKSYYVNNKKVSINKNKTIYNKKVKKGQKVTFKINFKKCKDDTFVMYRLNAIIK